MPEYLAVQLPTASVPESGENTTVYPPPAGPGLMSRVCPLVRLKSHVVPHASLRPAVRPKLAASHWPSGEIANARMKCWLSGSGRGDCDLRLWSRLGAGV